MTETENETKRADRPLLIYLYACILYSIFVIFCISLHYGWLEPDKDSELTTEGCIYLAMLLGGLLSSMYTSRFIKEYTQLHPAIHNVIRIWELAIFIITVVAIVDAYKKEDADLLLIASELLVVCAVLGGYIYWLRRKGKDGRTNEERITEKNEEKSKAARIKRYDEHKKMEERSDAGLPNYGWSEMSWDGRRSYYHVRNYLYAFSVMMVLIAVFMVIGKHWDDVNVQSGMFIVCWIFGVIILRGYITQHIDYAVTHHAVPYREGARYKLLTIASFTLVITALQGVLFEAREGYECWDIWGYSGAILTYVLFFVVTYLLMTAANRHNGHDFAFFDTDGYEKRLKDPREEEKD